MYKFKCKCGWHEILFVYSMHIEGTLTFRKYVGVCSKCSMKIDTMDIHQEDLVEQEYLC